jgi:hypothetical protein
MKAWFQDAHEEQGMYVIVPLSFIGIFSSLLSIYTVFKSSNYQVHKTNTARKVNQAHSKSQRQVSVSNNASSESKDSDEATLNDIDSFEVSLVPAAFVVTQLFYFGVFHSLANLPLGDKLLFGIHQRFWMQPSTLLFMWGGIGMNGILHFLQYFISRRKSAQGGRKIGAMKVKGSLSSIDGEPLLESTNSPKVLSNIVAIGGVAISCIAVVMQLNKWLPASDQSKALFFKNYATALLTPLPKNSILFVNYDMQWTSIRYIQKCEGVRNDITTINLSMMTYKWFQHKRFLYPNITFPAGYHGHAGGNFVKASKYIDLKHNAY